MKINFAVLVNDGTSYSWKEPGIAIVDYADLFEYQEERDDEFWMKIQTHFEEQSKFEFEYDVKYYTQIQDIEYEIVKRMAFDLEKYRKSYVRTHILIQNEFVRVLDSSITYEIIARHYGEQEELDIFFVFSNQAKEIWLKDGIRYYMHAREGVRHSCPHIHVDYRHESEASISLVDGTVLQGKLPKKVLKKAQIRILEEKAFLLGCWNKYTDGLKVDINHHFGMYPLDMRK